jgi:transposase InsO family protein
MPVELQNRVVEEVDATRRRSDWPTDRVLAALGVSRSSYYRWRRDRGKTLKEGGAGVPAPPPPSGSIYEVTGGEREAIVDYARRHAEIRHRELAWRMVDEDVAFVSPSTVYRVLREENLVCRWRGRKKRYREEDEKAGRPDEGWSTDLMHVKVGKATYYLLVFLDDYSRYIVHWALLLSMDGATVSVEAQAAVETLGLDAEGKALVKPAIRSDNGSGYISSEFRGVLTEHDLTHHRIRPHCPEENGLVERANRTLREALDGEELTSLAQAREVVGRLVQRYNEERLHSALGYLCPADYYRGAPATLHEERRRKLAQARHRRREENLKLRQLTLPLREEQSVA